MDTAKDVIQIDDHWYVLATSSRADDRTWVLKQDDIFGVFDRYGDIQHLGIGEQGLYLDGTRFLSRLELSINDRRPLLLNSTVKEDNSLLVVDLTTPDLYEDDRLVLRKGLLHVFRAKLLWHKVQYEHLRLTNFGDKEVCIRLAFEIDADYADLFEVRGSRRPRRGVDLPIRTEDKGLQLGYRGLDEVTRRTRVIFSLAPDLLSENKAAFDFSVEPGRHIDLYVNVVCESGGDLPPVLTYEDALARRNRALAAVHKKVGHTFCSNEQFNDWLNRSAADLHMLTTGVEQGAYPYAGVPWFSTSFGRDGIITALQCLWWYPEMARGVLHFLAETQAGEENPDRDAEPGKILHETRRGEMAALGEIPFDLYYGSVDATPLFVVLAGAYYDRTGDREFLESIWPNVQRALAWIDEYGDRDGDGFVEYARCSPNGLVQQGWKDSNDSVFHRDGTLAPGPIALCEVQGYVYQARQAGARLARLFGDSDRAQLLDRQAERLKQRFNEVFWCEELSTFALALDGNNELCRVRSSNAGHALYSGIAATEYARCTAETLMSEAMYSGWGVRTLAADERRYNPMSYHNGSVWPHDNAIIAMGLARYGLKEQAMRILTGLFDASISLDLHRLPELFCGFERLPGQGVTLYPVACSPQAWAAGTVFMSLQACLGMSFSPHKPQVIFHYPRMPDYLHRVEITNLRVGEGVIDLILRHHPHDVGVNVTRKQGDVDVAVVV